MNNTGMNVPNMSIAPIWTHIASTKPHILYVKMILVQSQVSRWHFQTPILNNIGMNVSNISNALIWTHHLVQMIAFKMFWSSWGKMSFRHLALSEGSFWQIIGVLLCFSSISQKKLSFKMAFPDPYLEQHWHECSKHLQSPHLDPHGLHQTSLMICQNDPCTKPSVKMTFPDPCLEQHWHECSKSLLTPHLDQMIAFEMFWSSWGKCH